MLLELSSPLDCVNHPIEEQKKYTAFYAEFHQDTINYHYSLKYYINNKL